MVVRRSPLYLYRFDMNFVKGFLTLRAIISSLKIQNPHHRIKKFGQFQWAQAPAAKNGPKGR